MVSRNTRRSVSDARRHAMRNSAPRTKDSHDLLPWADPYIASLMREHQMQKTPGRSQGATG